MSSLPHKAQVRVWGIEIRFPPSEAQLALQLPVQNQAEVSFSPFFCFRGI